MGATRCASPLNGTIPDLAGVIARRARETPARPTLRQSPERRDYAAFDARIARCRHHLVKTLALPPGARIAHLGFKTPDEIALLLACAGAGCVLVPLHWRLAPAGLDAIFADCTPAVLYVEEFQRGLATQLAPAAWALPPIGIGTADPARPTVPPAVTRVPARALEPRAPLLLWYY